MQLRLRPTSAAVVFLLAILTGAAAAARAQDAPPAPFTSQDLIPFDAAVRTGTLPNGLTYFIRQNARPAKRVSLRLAVKAGSLDEADDQQGLAHFIEHMAFNGSAHFKPGELVSYFESIGARLGPHVNAYTSFDETVYMLDLPTDKPDVVARRAHGARRLRRRAHARSDRGRQGARRRHRGMARRPRRQLARARQADPDPLLPLALRRAAADRQARHHPHGAGRAAARVLRHVVPPRPDGGHRRRRHRPGRRSSRPSGPTFGPLTPRAPPAAGCRTARCRCSSSCSSASSPIPS